ncbi:MAG TPA: glycoside hydrolase family 15 protein [Oligoflexus sp.]|uniref:glycoside hydrolase family 15 protein n=1 Tax=Oligoflexus sp. TaxID=1971216 RepID=UPI002D80E972|nr:glycoside hydrolase family 15 protein [Oligoflexus sp.]HET9241282.1 glycoside hydrolase family 15 protein [Oligoflexus sp.]
MGWAQEERKAYGHPGVATPWAPGAKEAVGTALHPESRLWFTLCQGIVTEVYFPRIDTPSLRELGFIVTDGRQFFSEEKCDAAADVTTEEWGVPNYTVRSRCKQGRYSLIKHITADPELPVLLQELHLLPAHKSDPLQLFALITPHLDNQVSHNSAWIDEWRGHPVAFSSHGKTFMAVISKPDFSAGSVGYVGSSDGWQVLRRDRKLSEVFHEASDGSVAITLQITRNPSCLAMGFGSSADEAAKNALTSLGRGFADAWTVNLQNWRRWLHGLPVDRPASARKELWMTSCLVLKTHMAKENPGGIIASLAMPWGEINGEGSRAGYHMIWPRDMCEAAGALVALNANAEVESTLHYLQRTQDQDGHWAQNMWVTGQAWWDGIQMDETASPLLLLYAISHRQRWTSEKLAEFWPMIQKAASYILAHGPVTGEGRWENEAGYSLYSLAVQVAALFLAGEMAKKLGKEAEARYLEEASDWWNSRIETWTYVRNTGLAHELNLEGYYANILPEGVSVPGKLPKASALLQTAKIEAQVSPDVLALVRFGLRDPHDPRIVASVRVVDHVLKSETPFGPGWHRYASDRYGEKPDGSPFDGSGKGRLWPILTGERAHYELAAGRRETAERLAQTMAAFSNASCLLPEQVWDADDIPDHHLARGCPTGSAMPLVWSHAEYIKLCLSLADGRIVDQEDVVRQHFIPHQPQKIIPIWRFNNKLRSVPCCPCFRIETATPARVRWSDDGWQSIHDIETRDNGFLLQSVDLCLQAGVKAVDFTFYWLNSQSWEGQDFHVCIGPDN